MTGPEFHYTMIIAKPAAEVWGALTEKGLVDRYHLAPLHTLELEAGGRISYGAEQEVIVGRILEVRAPEVLVHTFQFAGGAGPETRVAYGIEPLGEAVCSLTIDHTGFAEEDQSFANITGGWPVIASSLKTLLETGREISW